MNVFSSDHFSFAPSLLEHFYYYMCGWPGLCTCTQVVGKKKKKPWSIVVVGHSKIVCVYPSALMMMMSTGPTADHYWECGTCRAQWTMLSKAFRILRFEGEGRSVGRASFVLCRFIRGPFFSLLLLLNKWTFGRPHDTLVPFIRVLQTQRVYYNTALLFILGPIRLIEILEGGICFYWNK